MSSNDPQPPSPAPPTPGRRRRRWLRWTLPLLVVLLLSIVLAPWIAGGLAPGIAARAFAERFEGRLELGSCELSWFGRQVLRDVLVREPGGAEVARADLELPSLWELLRGGGRRLGSVHATLRGALVADDAGVTNLERALAPRAARGPAGAPAQPDRGAPSEDEGNPLAQLELDLVLESPGLSWSDARTRAGGRPFELRPLHAHLALQPGRAARAEASATLVGEEAGELQLQAQLEGLGSPGALPFTRAQASGRVHGFSSAMLDGLAAQHGRLAELLGPRFDLSFELGDLAARSGTLSLALQSERTHFVLEGRVEDGVLRCSAGRGFQLELGAPRGFVESTLAPYLPSGTKLVWPSAAEVWKLELGSLALPIPEPLPRDLAGWAELGRKLELDAKLSIPGPIGLENPITRGVHLNPALSGLVLELGAGPRKPAHLSLGARLIAGETGSISAELTCADPWTALASGALPSVDATLVLEDLSNATLDALLGREGFLAQGLGRALDLRVDLAGASLAGGTLRARVHSANVDLTLAGKLQDGALVCSGEDVLDLRLEPPTEWSARLLGGLLPPGAELRLEPKPLGLRLRELSLPLAARDMAQILAGTQCSLEATLPGFVLQLGAAASSARTLPLASAHLTGSLAKGGRAALRLDTLLGSGAPARCTLLAELPSLANLAGPQLPPLDFDLALDALDAAWLDRWALNDGRVPALAGGPLGLRLRGSALTLAGGRLDVSLRSPKLELALAFAGAERAWKLAGDAPSRVRLALDEADLARELVPRLPPGTTITLDPEARTLELRLEQLSLALPEDLGRLADPASLRSALRAELELALPGFGFENAQTRELGLHPRLSQARAQARLSEGGAISASLDASLAAAGESHLHAECAGHGLDDARVALKLEGLETSVADALLGRPALVSGLVGPTLALEASLAPASGGSALTLALRAPRAKLDLAGRWNAAALELTGEHACELRLAPDDAWLASAIGPWLPAGASLRLAGDAAGELVLRAEVPHLALPAQEQPWTGWLASTSLHVAAALPALVWKESADAPPLTLRGLALELALAPDFAPHASLKGEIVAEPPGTLACEIAALDPLRLLGEEHGLERFRAALHVRAQGVPVALVDALAKQDGLLLDGLGPRADLALESAALALDSGSFTLDLSAPPNSAHIDGALEQGLLRIAKPKGLTARFALGPLTSTRVVGRLLPLVCQVTKPSGAAPAAVEVDALALPLDGDLSKLDGHVRVDLGEVSFALFPGLSGLFGSQAAPKALALPAFDVPIHQGVVRYDKLVLPIGARSFAFHGSYDLVKGELVLGTEVPLEILGSKISSELDKARDFLDPKLLVPVEIRGAWNKPRLSIGQGFLDGVVKKALGNALEKGLEGLLKKKPKKD